MYFWKFIYCKSISLFIELYSIYKWTSKTKQEFPLIYFSRIPINIYSKNTCYPIFTWADYNQICQLIYEADFNQTFQLIRHSSLSWHVISNMSNFLRNDSKVVLKILFVKISATCSFVRTIGMQTLPSSILSLTKCLSTSTCFILFVCNHF